MECKQTMYVGRLCRLKYGLLWVPINMFPLAQMKPNLASSIVRCYLSNCENLMSMRQKLRKMFFFIFIFQIEEQVLYFFLPELGTASLTSTIWKKKSRKRSNITIKNDEYVRGDTTFGTDISHFSSNTKNL